MKLHEQVVSNLGYTKVANLYVKKPMTPEEIAHAKQEAEHQETLSKTGFWGSAAAGALIMANDTKRFLINHRSRAVEQPGTWGTWGGAIDAGEDASLAVKREIAEESGYRGKITTVPLYVFTKENFKYSNFLAIVESEFTPKLDWESQGYKWVGYGDWPTPVHFGLKKLLEDPASAKTIATYGKPTSPETFKSKSSLLQKMIDKLNRKVH